MGTVLYNGDKAERTYPQHRQNGSFKLKNGNRNGETEMNKRLYKSNTNKMVDGVCSGIAEYFDLDPTLVRLAWVLLCALGCSGFLAYLIAVVIIPREPCK